MISFFSRHPAVRCILLCVLSAVLLILSFPKTDFGPLVWVSLVPWLFALDACTGRRAFGFGYLTGILLFAGTIYWLGHATVTGTVCLVLYLSLYTGLFSTACVYFSRQSIGVRCLVLPSVWAVTEFVRGHLMSGFGWVNLAHTQYHNWLLIQITDIIGMYGISFLIVVVNILVKENLAFACGMAHAPARSTLVRTNTIVLAVLLAVFGYGIWRVTHPAKMEYLRVAIIQGNIPQDEKWLLTQREAIIEKYLRFSRQALEEKPDLLIWPETAFPGMAEEAPELMERIRELARSSSVPILLGIVTVRGDDYFNSAILVSAQGDIVDQYDKIHLVPFGEYIPFRKQLPFVADAIGVEDFSFGKKWTVFDQWSPGRKAPFSVAICFEDTLAYITRQFVRRGAQFLVNITNDAWFKDTKEPFMHLQASVFRAVEAKRSLVRAANTGISCGIDPYGRFFKYVQNDRHKKTYVDGTAVLWVPLNTEVTIYTKIGEVFTYICFLCILWACYIRKRNPKRE